MEKVDAIIVGGGPGGSSCAARLVRHGIECLALDRATFPRLKLCAGWITPQVVADLAIDPATYPHSFLTFEALHLHAKGLSYRCGRPSTRSAGSSSMPGSSPRSGAPVVSHNVKQIVPDGDGYVIDDLWRCRWLVGAGGTRCPVYRTLFRDLAPREEALQAAVLEQEFAYDWQEPGCHLWFFDHGLPGYSWFVPKAGGHLNVGIGGMAGKLKAKGQTIKQHWERLATKLERRGLVLGHAWDTGGYTYYLRGRADHVRAGNAFLVGDAAGLATRDFCEGIGPAVRSGQLAADAIATGRSYTSAAVSAHSAEHRLVKHALDRAFCGQARGRAALPEGSSDVA